MTNPFANPFNPFNPFYGEEGRKAIMVCPSETGLSGIAVPPGATVADRMVGAVYFLREIEPMHLSVEGLRS